MLSSRLRAGLSGEAPGGSLLPGGSLIPGGSLLSEGGLSGATPGGSMREFPSGCRLRPGLDTEGGLRESPGSGRE